MTRLRRIGSETVNCRVGQAAGGPRRPTNGPRRRDRWAVVASLLVPPYGNSQRSPFEWVAGAVQGITVIAFVVGTIAMAQSSEIPVNREPAATAARDPERGAFAASYQYEKAGNYREAIAALDQVREVSQRPYLLNLRLGWLHYLSGDNNTAGQFYRSAIEAEPAATEPRVGYLLPLLAQERYGDAERVARDTLEIDPKNYYANLRLATALREQDKLTEAARVASRMLELQPTDVSVLSELAQTYEAGGRTADAREIYEKVLMLAPANAIARERLGLSAQPLSTDLDDAGMEMYGEAADGCAPYYPLTLSVSPYYAYLDYGAGSIKSHGNTWGVYGSLSALNSIEASYEYTNIDFRDGTCLAQNDFTAVYSYLRRPNWKLRFGGHFIDNNDLFTDGAWTLFAGLHYYQTDVWDIGVDTYFTRYGNQPLNQNVTQITPHIGIQQLSWRSITIRLDLRGYYINTNEEVPTVGHEDFFSLDARLGFNRGRYGLALQAWTGEQVFAVRRDGFVIYNLAERHIGGYGGEFRYRLGHRSTFTARISDEYFTDIINGADSHQLVTALLWTCTF